MLTALVALFVVRSSSTNLLVVRLMVTGYWGPLVETESTERPDLKSLYSPFLRNLCSSNVIGCDSQNLKAKYFFYSLLFLFYFFGGQIRSTRWKCYQ